MQAAALLAVAFLGVALGFLSRLFERYILPSKPIGHIKPNQSASISDITKHENPEDFVTVCSDDQFSARVKRKPMGLRARAIVQTDAEKQAVQGHGLHCGEVV